MQLRRESIEHRAGDDDLARTGLLRDTGADVDCDPADLAVDDLAFARVKTGADLQAELVDALANCVGAADRAGGPVEAGEEAIACGIELSPLEPHQLSAHA